MKRIALILLALGLVAGAAFAESDGSGSAINLNGGPLSIRNLIQLGAGVKVDRRLLGLSARVAGRQQAAQQQADQQPAP